MGSMVSLGVGKLELDWGKNNFFRNHSKLFLPSDIKKIPYYYADGVTEYKEGCSRKLKDVKRRLELLGYSMSRLKEFYESSLSSVPDYYPDAKIQFEDFSRIITAIQLENIPLDEEGDDYNLGEFVSIYLFRNPEFNKVFNLASTVTTDIGTIFENLDPYITLRLLIENPANLERELQWRYADIVEGGYVTQDEIHESVSDEEKILIVTEGSSDLFVINRAIELLCPDISDFFHYVDMGEHYPFTGTGNLYKFCQGLASIKIQNKVLVIYDNDVVGCEKFELTQQLTLPHNMKVTKLPDYPGFNDFQTIGPNGSNRENINGRAVSIEHFLDLHYDVGFEPIVRWTSYNEKADAYQGVLMNKDMYVKKFKKVNSTSPDYDFSKLRFLLDHLYEQCVT